MTIIAFFNQKGGCGKTTTAVHFSFWLRSLRKSLIFVDADAQRSSTQWLTSMNNACDVIPIASSDYFLDTLPAICHEYDFTIVDCPAGISDLTRTILLKSDLVVIPCQPSGIDLWSTSQAVKYIFQVKDIRKGFPDAVIFLSKAVKGTRLKVETLAELNNLPIPIMDTIIHQKQIIAEVFDRQKTVWDSSDNLALDSKSEFNALFIEIVKHTNIFELPDFYILPNFS
jgi:chromosome partitioning protein